MIMKLERKFKVKDSLSILAKISDSVYEIDGYKCDDGWIIANSHLSGLEDALLRVSFDEENIGLSIYLTIIPKQNTIEIQIYGVTLLSEDEEYDEDSYIDPNSDRINDILNELVDRIQLKSK